MVNLKGGKWSYDDENRKKIPRDIELSLNLIKVKETKHTTKLKDIIKAKFASHPGDVNNFWFPTTHKDAA